MLLGFLASGALGLGLGACSSQTPAQVSEDSTDSEKSTSTTRRTAPKKVAKPKPVAPKLTPEAEKYLKDARAELDAKQYSAARAMIELSALENAAGEPVYATQSRAMLAELERTLFEKALNDGDLQKAYSQRILAAKAEPDPAHSAEDLVEAIKVGQQIGVMPAKLAPLASEAVALQTRSKEAQTLAAQLWDDAAQPARALPYYQWLHKVSPDNITAATRLATILLAEQKIQESRRLFEQIYTAHPDHIIAGIQLAEIYAKLGSFERASAVYEKLLAAHPERPAILMRYASYLSARGEQERAAELKARARENMPGIKKKKMRRLR